MDFFEFAWIALIVFYFVLRSIGGGRRKSPAGTPRKTPPQGESRQRPDEELGAALDEIRRALGFPDQDKAPSSKDKTRTPGTVLNDRQAVRETEQETARERPDVNDHGRRIPERRIRTEETRRSVSERPVNGDPIGRPKVSDRARSASQKLGTDGPSAGDAIVPDLPPLHASFSEEEAFETLGRHPHRRTRHNLQVINPYKTPRRRQLPGVLKTLHRRASLREAFLLKEILDRPKSLRRH